MNYRHIKLIGTQFGSQLIAYALGGRIERLPSLSDHQQLYIGKESINLRKSFFGLNYVAEQMEGLDEEEQGDMESIGILKVHTDMVAKLPDKAILHGSSNRCHNEIWTIADRVLCLQSSPELNTTYIKELIINKLYDVGKLDDN